MTTHFKKLGFIKALLLAAILACGINRAQAQAIVTGMANSFGVLGGSTVSASASAGHITGDVGVSPGSSITLGGTTVTGSIFANIPPATTGHTDALTAYNQMAGLAVSVGGVLTGQDLGGKVLPPGVYFYSSSAQLTGILTLSGQGQYVFQIGSTLTTASGSSINLIGGADASNVFFQVGSSATLGTGTSFNGTIIALQSGTMTSGSTLNGHFIAVNGALTLDANTITTTTNLIVNATTFDLGASRNEPVSVVTLSNAGSILGTGTSALLNTGNYNLEDGVVTAILSGTGSALNKTTNGTVSLSGANNYTGATTITAGTLAVNNLSGSGTGTGPVAVLNGATLTGAGSVGNVAVNSGGILAPGNGGIGNLTMSTLTLATGSISNFEFSGIANDQLTVTGTNGLALGNGAIIDLYQVGTTSAFITLGTYHLIGYVGTVTGSAANLTVGTTTGGLNFNFSTTGTFLDLTISVANGPGSWSATGNGNWSDSTKWAGSIVADGAGNTAIFGSSIIAASTVTLDGNRTVGGITFGNANSYTIAPGTGSLTLDNLGATAVIAVSLGNHTIASPIILTTGGMTAQVSVGTSLTISSIISQNATAGLTKAGLGTLTLSGLNTYTGDTIVTGGTLREGVSNAIANGSNLTVNGTTAVFDLGVSHNDTVGTVTLDGNGSITGTGTSTLSSTGSFQLMNGTVTAILAGTGTALNKTTNGTVTLSGLNTYTGNTTVTAGTLTESSTGAIADTSNLTVNGNTAVFALGANHSDSVGIVTLDGNGSITGTGNSTLTSTGSFQVMNGTVTAILAGPGIAMNKTTNGTVTLSGVNTYTGNTTVTAGTLTESSTGAIADTSNLIVNGSTAVFALGANHSDTVGIVTLDGNGSITGTGNSTLTSTGSFQVMNGTVTAILAGSGIALNKTTNGTVTLAGQNTYTGNTTVSVGTLVISPTGGLVNTSIVNVSPGATLTLFRNVTAVALNNNGTINGNSTLTATTYNLNNGTQIDTSLGNGTVISNGNVGVNGTLGATNITIQTGTMTLQQPNLLSPNATVDIVTGAMLVVGNGNTTILGLNGNGTLNESNGILTVVNGLDTFNGTIIGAVSTNGTLISNGNLSIAAGTVAAYPNGTMVTGGTLSVNGILITPTTTVTTGGTLGGNGTITGDVFDNGGTISPGNSPGIMTIGGNYTEAGTLQIEIGGTSGPGSPTGHDQVVVGGNTTIVPTTSTLQLVKFNPGYEPVKGDTFKIISGAAGSISGHFATFTSNFTNDLIFNVDTGQVIGTGLPAGSSVLGAIPGLNSDQKKMITSMQVGDHQFGGGDLLVLLLTPANAGKSSQILNQASPEAYAGLSDYAVRATQAYRNTAIEMAPIAQSGAFSLFSGFSHLDTGSDSSQNQADYDLESNGAVAGARVKLGPLVTLGVFTGFDFGSVKSTYLSSTVTGQVFGAFVKVDPLVDHRLDVTGGFTYGTFTSKGTRQTFSGASSMPSVDSSDYRFDLGARYLALKKEKFSLSPEVNLTLGQSKVDDFTETNIANPLQALHVHGQNNTSFVAGLGLNGVYSVTSKLDLNARIGISQELDHSHRDVTANVANHTGTYSVRAPGMGDTQFNLGVGVNFNVTQQLRVGLSYQAGFSDKSKMSNAIFLGASLSF